MFLSDLKNVHLRSNYWYFDETSDAFVGQPVILFVDQQNTEQPNLQSVLKKCIVIYHVKYVCSVC